MKDITVCVMSCGEETLEDCMIALQPFLNNGCILQRVTNVAPQVKALNQMIRQCQTEWLIPVDGDMILNHDAYNRIYRAIDKFGHDTNWHTILFKLWDTLTEREILALKILRTKIMKVHLFNESATPDVEHFLRLTAAGYTCIDQLLVKNPIGKHVVRGKHFCYHKYRDVYQTLRVHGFEWDSGAFMGGTTILEKSKRHFDFFVKKYAETNNDDYLWCIAGMMDGLLSPIENKSKSLANINYRFNVDEGMGAYLNWYMHEYKKSMAILLF